MKRFRQMEKVLAQNHILSDDLKCGHNYTTTTKHLADGSCQVNLFLKYGIFSAKLEDAYKQVARNYFR